MSSFSTNPNAPAVVQHDIQCRYCGYNLRGLAEARCPECGNAFDPDDIAICKVPWLHRRRIGRWTAYFQTAWMVTISPRRFKEELFRSMGRVEWEARRFREWNIAIAIASVCIASFICQCLSSRPSPAFIAIALVFTVAVGLSLLVLLTFATAILFTPPPNFSSSLYHYSSAPLAGSPIIALCIILGVPYTNDAFLAIAGLLSMMVFARMAWLMMLAYGVDERMDRSRKIVFAIFTLPGIWLTALIVTAITAAVCMATAVAFFVVVDLGLGF